MITKPLPDNFVAGHARLEWPEAAWGVENGWAEPRFVGRLADERRPGTRPVARTDERGDALALARSLAVAQPGRRGGDPASVWLYLALRWVRDNAGSVRDALEAVEEVYADFGYPAEIEHFVRYMPPRDGHDPTLHSREQNEQRLYDALSAYVDERESAFR